MGNLSKKTVGLLMGGISGEDYLSYRSAKEIFFHIDREKYDVIGIEWEKNGSFIEYEKNSLSEKRKSYRNIADCFGSICIDIIFITIHGGKECGGKLAGMFDLLNIPYTGNGFFTSFVGMNKGLSKLMFKQEGILTPEYALISKKDIEYPDQKRKYIEQHIGYPCMFKPACSGSSIGVKKFWDFESLIDYAKIFLKEEDHVIAEAFIEGTELSVGVCGRYDREKRVLPIAQLIYAGEFFDHECKYKNQYSVAFPEIPDSLKDQLEQISCRIHEILMFEGISRTDFIVSNSPPLKLTPPTPLSNSPPRPPSLWKREGGMGGEFLEKRGVGGEFEKDRGASGESSEKDSGHFAAYCLEVNTHTGLGGHSIFPAMMKQAGISYKDIIDDLIRWRLEKNDECGMMKEA